MTTTTAINTKPHIDGDGEMTYNLKFSVTANVEVTIWAKPGLSMGDLLDHIAWPDLPPVDVDIEEISNQDIVEGELMGIDYLTEDDTYLPYIQGELPI